jgi:hypothetical protein
MIITGSLDRPSLTSTVTGTLLSSVGALLPVGYFAPLEIRWNAESL